MTNLTALTSRLTNAHQRIDGKVDKDGGIISGLMEFAAGIKLDNMSDPSTPASGDVILYSSTAGIARYVTDTGQVGNVPQTQGNIQQFNVTGTGFSGLSAAYTIKGNDGNVGTTYRLKVFGGGTQATGATPAMGIRTNAFGGGHATTGGGSTIPATKQFNIEVESVVTIVTTGAGGTAHMKTSGIISCTQRANEGDFVPVCFMNFVSAVSVDTTSDTTMSIEGAWTATAGSPTVGGYYSIFERMAALWQSAVRRAAPRLTRS